MSANPWNAQLKQLQQQNADKLLEQSREAFARGDCTNGQYWLRVLQADPAVAKAAGKRGSKLLKSVAKKCPL